jgi:hypothetical protein
MKTKLILSILFSLLVAVFPAPAIGTALNMSPAVIAGGLFALQFVPMQMSGLTMAGVYREVWTGAVKEEMSKLEDASFLEGIEDYSRYVSNVGNENQVIHLVYMGVLPEVLINNTTYPIPIQTLDQEDISINLDKYQTKATPVTDDELFALSYDKIATVKGKHSKAITRTKFKKAIHSVAPADASKSAMPVIVTTGEDDGTGRKKLIPADLLTLKRKLDDLEIPDEGRRLVLCAEHVNDLLTQDQTFKEQYYNYTTGKIANAYGFELYTYSGNPYYTVATKVKLAFGAVPQATDERASIFFSLERVAKASGWVKMYYKKAETDPENQRNLMNFRHHYIVMPTREEGRGAIISAKV